MAVGQPHRCRLGPRTTRVVVEVDAARRTRMASNTSYVVERRNFEPSGCYRIRYTKQGMIEDREPSLVAVTASSLVLFDPSRDAHDAPLPPPRQGNLIIPTAG